ncbi:hypothetical protein BXZ70DRAFT_482736 [Cristinia sonorae]|uniref:Uncharacterized protein n=1 Tax=Cristinia sonorae TaxID=1940300 RepID=A0A8K0UGX3_9AGAR|nr:hypothetical protein BXZ70DRAFT_482736 [Cristinia sonorae]
MAARIEINPYNQQCPNFGADEYEEIRILFSQARPDDDPIAHLETAWKTRNEQDKALWDAQVEADGPPEPVPPPPRLPRAANPGQPLLTFTAGKRVGRIGDQICAYARNRLRNFEYLPLFYCTAAGIEATKASSTALSDGYGLVPSENGLQIRPCNEFKAYQHVVPDENLSWAEVSDASYLFMAEIKALDWPRETVLAIHSFFYQLETHELRRREGGLEVLVHYQAIVRKSWHDHIDRKVELFDISKIDDEVMADCKEIVASRRRKLQVKEDEDRERRFEEMMKLNSSLSTRNPRDSRFDRNHSRSFMSSSSQRRSASPPPRRGPQEEFRRSYNHDSRRSFREESRDRRHRPFQDESFPSSKSLSASRDGTTLIAAGGVCVICLSRRTHNLSKCNATKLYNGTPAHVHRNKEGRIVDRHNQELCFEWQLAQGCRSKSVSHRHECSGCGRQDHGAILCPLAEKV